MLTASDRELTWQLAEQLTADPSGAVRERLLNSLARLTTDDRDRALDLIARMFEDERARATPHQGFLNSASRLLIESWVHFDAPQGRSQLDAIAADPGAYADTARATFFALRTLTTYGEPGDLEAESGRSESGRRTRQPRMHRALLRLRRLPGHSRQPATSRQRSQA